MYFSLLSLCHLAKEGFNGLATIFWNKLDLETLNPKQENTHKLQNEQQQQKKKNWGGMMGRGHSIGNTLSKFIYLICTVLMKKL